MNLLGEKLGPPQVADALLTIDEMKWQEKERSPVAVKARRREQVRVSEMKHRSDDVNSRAKALLPSALAALDAGDTASYQAACKRCERAGSEHASVASELADHEAGEATAKSAGEWRLRLHDLRHKTAVMEDVFREAQETRDRLEADLRERLRAAVGKSIEAIDSAYKELREQQRAEVLALCADREPLGRLNFLLERKPLDQLLGGKV